jgi:hypothetical protein
MKRTPSNCSMIPNHRNRAMKGSSAPEIKSRATVRMYSVTITGIVMAIPVSSVCWVRS